MNRRRTPPRLAKLTGMPTSENQGAARLSQRKMSGATVHQAEKVKLV